VRRVREPASSTSLRDGVDVVTFLSDYGTSDEFVGVCHGVMERAAPGVHVIDLTHGIPRHDVRAGALTLRSALPYLPAGVHLAIVDPEVGGSRRAVALLCAHGNRRLVGPDNGLLWPAADRLGGIVEAIDIAHSPHRLEPVSATFHGRDLFAPVAARLAAGDPFSAAGAPVDPDELVQLALPSARIEDGTLVAHVLTADGFGNVILDATHDDLARWGLRLGRVVEVEAGAGTVRARFARAFSDVGAGELLVYEDAQRHLALAVNRASALEELGVARDDELRLRPVS
jgi:S-adenosyl-L-methionine hydrolase (adenosine-forming)